MPEICRFLGVAIKMFFDDHNPPHFHAEYGDYRAQIDIQRCCVLGGNLPPRVTGLAIKWATLHRMNFSMTGIGHRRTKSFSGLPHWNNP